MSVDQTIDGAEALRRAKSWRLAVGDQAAPPTDIARELLAAIVRGEILVWPPRACASANVGDGETDARQACATISELRLDRGFFHAWLARNPTPSATKAQQIDNSDEVVRPLAAIDVVSGRRWTDGGLRDHCARVAHVRGWLHDDANAVAPLPSDARSAVEDWAERVEADESAFHVGRARLMALAKTSGVLGRGVDGQMRRMEKAAALAPDVSMDVVGGGFIPASHIPIASDDRDRAHKACEAIGEVFFYAAELKAHRDPPKRPTIDRESAAVRLLCASFLEWQDRGGNMHDAPKRAAWLAGEGFEMVGTKAGAERAWARAVASDPRFALLRQRGRRPGKA